MGFSSLFKTKDPTKVPLHHTPPVSSSHASPPPSWRWPSPSCRHPKTHSFRASMPPPQRTTSEVEEEEEEREEMEESGDYHYRQVDVKDLRSERLFFDPPPSEASSILRGSTAPSTPSSPSRMIGGGGGDGPSVEEMELDSSDPYLDFRASMEEVVAVLGVRDWDSLAALLSWYLRVNGKPTHVFILGAFVDLLLDLVSVGSSSNSNLTAASCCSPSTTSSSSSCLCSGFSSPFPVLFPSREEPPVPQEEMEEEEEEVVAEEEEEEAAI